MGDPRGAGFLAEWEDGAGRADVLGVDVLAAGLLAVLGDSFLRVREEQRLCVSGGLRPADVCGARGDDCVARISRAWLIEMVDEFYIASPQLAKFSAMDAGNKRCTWVVQSVWLCCFRKARTNNGTDAISKIPSHQNRRIRKI